MNITEEINILLIEDNPDDAMLINEYFNDINENHNGVSVKLTHADFLGKGLETVEKSKYDLILLDLSLPDSFGLNSLDKLRDKLDLIPVIIMTGLDDEKTGMEAIKRGAQDYLIKGRFDIDLLYRSIRYSRERHRLSCELRDLSLKDSMTGLYNRRGLMTLCEHYMKTARRGGGSVAGIYIDVDKMKSINDRYGHGEGDGALIAISEIMKTSFRESDILARIGGDEFFIFSIIDSESGLKALLDRFKINLDAYNNGRKKTYDLSCSIGVYYNDGSKPLTIDQLIEKADALMYKNKVKYAHPKNPRC